MVQWRIRHEAWRLIDFDQPRLRLLVKEDVDAEDLEAELVLEVLRFCCSLDVSDLITARNYRLHGQLFELLPALSRGDNLRVFFSL